MSDFHPGLILMLTGLLSFFLSEKMRTAVGLAGSVSALAVALALTEKSSLTFAFTQDITLQMIHADSLAKLFVLIFCVMAVILSVYSASGCGRGEKGASLIYAGSSMGVVLAGDWITLICFWELMAVSSWYLVFAAKTRKAVRASYRYLVMHLFGGNLLLAGAVFVCAEQGISLQLLTGNAGAGCMMVFIGVCVNAAVPPLHTWAADAYPESTPAGTAFMGSYTTKAAIYAMIRLFAGTEELILWGAVMAVFGAVMALIENDLRRLLSYHIVSQLGMMIAALGTETAAGIDGAALHAAFNILYKGVLLMGAGAVILATGKRKITELSGLGRKMPVTAVCFFIGSLSIAGMPFLNGFASKALIMEALSGQQAAYRLVMLAGIGTWLSITMKINYFVFWGRRDTRETQLLKKVPRSMEGAMMIGTVLCVFTGLFPDLFYEMTPYQTMGHPFTTEHIMEYIGIFAGATVAFTVFLKKMAPHEKISLDFDWLYRRALAPFLKGLSKGVDSVFSTAMKVGDDFLSLIKYVLKNPGRNLFSAARTEERKAEDSTGRFEGDMPVGTFMQIFIVFCVIAFVVIMILE